MQPGPLCRALAEDEATKNIPISVDTYYAEVAAAAVGAGAALVNDVSGGSLDDAMLPTVRCAGLLCAGLRWAAFVLWGMIWCRRLVGLLGGNACWVRQGRGRATACPGAAGLPHQG